MTQQQGRQRLRLSGGAFFIGTAGRGFRQAILLLFSPDKKVY
jgi:hypothetical protein